MSVLTSIKDYLQKKTAVSIEKPVEEAYDIWSGSYDSQPGNLMLDLDAAIFSILTRDILLQSKVIADIGCGTGRHWEKLYKRSPAMIRGYDVSAGMLNQLKNKFPTAIITQVKNNLLTDLADASVDCLISTLTIAHINNIDEAIANWTRVLKDDGDLIITDFHPAILAQGGKRSFRHEHKTFSVTNYVHPVNEVILVLEKYGFHIVQREERYVNESVKSYYEAQHAMTVYEQYKGMPVIYGLHLKR